MTTPTTRWNDRDDLLALRRLLRPINPVPLSPGVPVADLSRPAEAHGDSRLDAGSGPGSGSGRAAHDASDPRAEALLARILTTARGPRGSRDAEASSRGRTPAVSRRTVLTTAAVVLAAAATGAGVLTAGVVSLPWNQTAPAAGAYAATPPLLRYAPLTGTAAQVLTRIAARTAGLPDDTGTGRYVRTSSQDWYLWTRVGGDGHTVQSEVMPQQVTTWVAADGSGRSVVSYHQPGLPWTTQDDATFGPGDRGFSWPLGSLSAEDAPLAAQLGVGHPASNGAAERLVAVNDLVREQPLRPSVRAAVLRYLAATPTLQLQGATTDRLGRRGVVVSLDSDYSGLPTRYTLIVDPQDGRVLAWEEMLTTTAGRLNVPVPSVIGYSAYRDSRYVATDHE